MYTHFPNSDLPTPGQILVLWAPSSAVSPEFHCHTPPMHSYCCGKHQHLATARWKPRPCFSHASSPVGVLCKPAFYFLEIPALPPTLGRLSLPFPSSGIFSPSLCPPPTWLTARLSSDHSSTTSSFRKPFLTSQNLAGLLLSSQDHLPYLWKSCIHFQLLLHARDYSINISLRD